ncbi:hypothetical protein I4200191B4_13320 [Pseudoflavonifractor gallinarum]
MPPPWTTSGRAWIVWSGSWQNNSIYVILPYNMIRRAPGTQRDLCAGRSFLGKEDSAFWGTIACMEHMCYNLLHIVALQVA